MYEDEIDDVNVEDGFDEEEVIVNVVDERDEADRVEPFADDDDDDTEPTEEELAAVSKKVQKRINTLTAKFHDQRRKAEAADRMQAEAIRFAEQTHAENAQMRKVLAEGEAVVLSEVRSRVKTEVEHATRLHIAALESGDPSEIAASQRALNKAQIQEANAENYRPQVSQTPPETQRPPQQQQQRVDHDFEAWREKNEWWDTNPMLRAAATALHNQLVQNANKGGEPVGTELYYRQVDAAMRPLVASFQVPPGGKGASVPVSAPAPSVVAPTSRNAAVKSPRTVTLTDSAAKLAKRLRIPLELYASEVRKLDGTNQ